MRDPYLYDDVNVLRNKLDIKDSKKLDKYESDITYFNFLDVDDAFADASFDFNRLCNIHAFIFGDIFDWAGKVRTIPMVKGERVLGGDTVRYAQPGDIEVEAKKAINALTQTNWTVLDTDQTAETFARLIAALWQIHPFREGNTRTVITFATQFAFACGFPMDKDLLHESSGYVRDALVKASDGEYSDYSYLTKIFKDAILRG